MKSCTCILIILIFYLNNFHPDNNLSNKFDFTFCCTFVLQTNNIDTLENSRESMKRAILPLILETY